MSLGDRRGVRRVRKLPSLSPTGKEHLCKEDSNPRHHHHCSHKISIEKMSQGKVFSIYKRQIVHDLVSGENEVDHQQRERTHDEIEESNSIEEENSITRRVRGRCIFFMSFHFQEEHMPKDLLLTTRELKWDTQFFGSFLTSEKWELISLDTRLMITRHFFLFHPKPLLVSPLEFNH